MARPLKQGLDYYPLDQGWRNDPKVMAMRHRFGTPAALAFYLTIIDICYGEPDGRLDISSGEITVMLAADIGIDEQQFETMMEFALKVKLFDQQAYANGYLTSNGIQKRASPVWEKRRRERERYKAKTDVPAELPVPDTDGNAVSDNGNAVPAAETRVSANKSREEKTRVNDSTPRARPADAAAASSVSSSKPETPQQSIIRAAWEAHGFDGTPGGRGYAGLIKLVQEHGIPIVQEWIAHICQTQPAIPDGAEPWPWFCKQFRRAMSRDFEWRNQSGGNGRAPRKGAAQAWTAEQFAEEQERMKDPNYDPWMGETR